MRFVKAHGTANDFVVVDDPDDEVTLSAPLVRALCDRRRGVGADGVLRLGAARAGGDVFMDYRNADGSVVEMCGNGVRVVAKHVVDHGRVEPGDGVVAVETRAGLRRARVETAGGRVVSVTVDMGAPAFAPAGVPFDADGADPDPDGVAAVTVAGQQVGLSALSMGNPHAVVVVDDVEAAPVGTLGPALERHRRFPERVNVEFVQVVDRGRLRVRFWERGVGETASCGTGVCAAAVAAHRRGLADPAVEVEVPGGSLGVVWRDPRGGGPVELTGPAVEVASGELADAWLAAVDGEGLETTWEVADADTDPVVPA